MDDQARAVVLSLSKLVQEDDESINIEEKIRAVIDIGHSVCCGLSLIRISFDEKAKKEMKYTIELQLIRK